MKESQLKYIDKRITPYLLRVMLIVLAAFMQPAAIAAIIVDDSTSGKNVGTNITDYTATVTTKLGLNVRTGPGISYPRISALRYGSKVRVTHRHGGWSKISFGSSKNAYVSNKYLRANIRPGTSSASGNNRSSSTSTTTGQINSNDLNVADYRAIVTASALKVRSGPGTNHRIISKRYRNSSVLVTHHHGIWRKLTWSQGSNAYVHGDYLRKQDTSSRLSNLNARLDGVADPEGLLAHPSTPPATSSDECKKEQPRESELLQTPYLAAAKEGVKMHDQPNAGCPHYNNRFNKGENAKVLAERGNWAFISNEFNEQTGWIVKDSFLYAHRPAPEPHSGNRIVNTMAELGCIVSSTVTALPPSSSFKEFALSMASNTACGSSFTTAREVQRTCMVEAGITISGCPWVNQEPYKSNVDAWLALPNTTNGHSQAVDGRVLSAEDAYVNCLWAAANFGPEHWSLGWNHGGCVGVPRQKP